MINLKDYSTGYRRSRLLEIMLGQIHNLKHDLGGCELAEKYRPDIFAFTEEDVLECSNFENMPDDWKKLARACIKSIRL